MERGEQHRREMLQQELKYFACAARAVVVARHLLAHCSKVAAQDAAAAATANWHAAWMIVLQSVVRLALGQRKADSQLRVSFFQSASSLYLVWYTSHSRSRMLPGVVVVSRARHRGLWVRLQRQQLEHVALHFAVAHAPPGPSFLRQQRVLRPRAGDGCS